MSFLMVGGKAPSFCNAPREAVLTVTTAVKIKMTVKRYTSSKAGTRGSNFFLLRDTETGTFTPRY